MTDTQNIPSATRFEICWKECPDQADWDGDAIVKLGFPTHAEAFEALKTMIASDKFAYGNGTYGIVDHADESVVLIDGAEYGPSAWELDEMEYAYA